MGSDDVTIRLKMVADGVDQQVKSSEAIANNYANAARSAQQMGAPQARRAAAAGAMTTSENIEYGRARGNLGGTGASARDFANQAQGLGGLVRLYATYAANVFAVGAAFRALSDAMNTSNMVRGLDQLGAASGRALGNLSKQLVEVTDGAISLREAMVSVAQTSSAGMSSQNILRLGAAAQKASQALGVSMGDALNRLSRGITKLEPELLDELGIFIRIDDAAEKYARQLGKTTGSLTEFERRQGFALAVLDQAEQKFNKLNLVANPYDKLAASVANLTQKLLEFINIGLGPVVNFLSQSPAALGAAILGIGTLILKQALPVLTMYREGLKKARDVSLASTAESSGEFRKSVVAAKQRALDLAEAEADARIKAADDADKKLRAIRESSFVKEKTKVLEILTKASQDVTQADLDYLTKQGDKNVKTNQKLAGSYYEVRDALLASKNAELSSATAQEELAKAKTKLNDNVLRSTEADLNFKKQVRRAALDESALVTANTAKQKGYFAALNAGYRDVMSKRKEIELDIPILDPKTGRATEQTEKVITKGLGNMGAALGVLRVGVAATGELLTSLVSKLGTLGIYASIAVAGFEFFNKILSSSQKESESFAKSQELINGALKNTGATLDAILGKNIDSILSIDSVQARANAFNDLSDAILKTSKDFDKLIAAQNTWSRFFDETARFFGKTLGEIGQGFGGLTGILLRGTSKISQALFGKGAQAEYSDQLAETIMAALAVAETDIQRQSMGIALQDILGPIDLTNLENLKKQINTIPLAELGDKGIAASKAIKQISDEANNSASVLSSVRESIKTVSKEIDSLNTSLLPTDRLGKIGIGFIDTSASLTKALADTKNGILAIKEVMDSMQVMSLLPPELAQQLIKDKEQINAVVSQLGQARETLRNIRAEIAKLPAEGGDTETIVKRTALKENQARQEKFVADLESRAASITTKYTTKIQVAVFEEGVKKLEASLKFGMQQAAIASAKAYLNVLGAVGGRTAEQETKLGLQELNIQRQVIEAQYQSKLALERNTIALERNTLEQAQSDLRAKVARQGGPTAEDNRKAIELSERSLTLAQKEEFLKTDPTLKKFSDARKSQNEFEKKAAMELGSLMSVMYGKQIQLAQIAGQKSQVLAQGLLKEQREIAEFKNKELDLSIKSNQQSLDNITLNQSLIGIYDSGLAAQRATLEQSLIQQNAEKEINKLLADQAVLRKLEGRPDIDEKKRQEALKLLQDKEAAAKKKRDQDIVASQRKFRIDDAKQAEEFAKKERDNAFQILQANNEIYTTRLDQSLQYLQLLEAFGVEDKLSAIQQRARVDLLKEDLQLQTQLQNINNQQLGIDAKRAMIKLLAKEGAPTTALVAEADREQQLLNAQRDSILAANDARTRGIKLQAEQNIQLERQNYFLEQATKTSDTLSNNFGKTGERLGQAVDGFSKIAINLEKSEKAQTDFNKRSREMTEDSSAEQWASFWEEKDRLEKKSAQDELDRNAMALSSTKKLFKEKTGAYKAFGALEKAYHIARLIMSAKEIATQIANTVSFVTQSITRQGAAAAEAGTLGVKAVINAMSTLPPPFNFAAGAAMTAVVAGLLASIGKTFRGSSKSSGPTKEQQEASFGTAMGYNSSGDKVQVRQGVLGFPDEKINSITKNIELIERYTDDGLVYDTKILDTLRSIDRGITGMTVAIFKAQGITTGQYANIGSKLDTKTVASNIAAIGVGALGAGAGALIGASIVGQGFGAAIATSISSAVGGLVGQTVAEGIGIAVTSAFDLAVPGLGIALGALLGSALKTKTYNRIDESGLLLKGSFEDLANNTEQAVQAFAKVTVKAENSFDKWTVWAGDVVKPLDEISGGKSVVNQIQGTFRDITTLFIELGKGYGRSETEIRSLLSTVEGIDLRLDLKTMDAKAAGEKLTVALSAIIDDAAQVLFGKDFEEYIKSGETLTDAVVRTITGLQAVRSQLVATGMSISYITKDLAGIKISETILEAFGGIDKFQEKMQNFRKAFLSESEQIANFAPTLQERLEELGVTGVDTMNEFKELVLSIKPVTPEAARLQNALIELAPAFEKVYKEVDTLLETLRKETITLNSTLTPQEIAIRDITLKTGEYIEKLKASGVATEANVKQILEWSKASALSQFRSNLRTAFDDRKRELESNISALKKVKETLTDLKNSLLVGELSPLTPLQQYGELFGEYQKTLINIKSTDAATADAAKQAFPQLAKQLLDAGKGLFASSSVYQNLIDTVSSDLETTGTFIDSQISEQENLINELNKDYLPIFADIATNTKSTSDKLADAKEIWDSISQIDTSSLTTSVILSLQQGTTPQQSIADALNMQAPIIAAATAEAIKIANGNRTVDYVVEDSIIRVTTAATTSLTTLATVADTAITNLNTTAKKIYEFIPTDMKNQDSLLMQPPLRASGGPVIANNPYIVGEVGPELFVPKTSGMIVPNNMLQNNNDQTDREILYKLDQLIEAVVVSNNQNAQAITNTLESVKSRKTWESGQVYGRVSG